MSKIRQGIDLSYVDFVFSNRLGGSSTKPYDSLNLGLHVGDDDGDVLRNRELLYRALEKRGKIPPHPKWSFLNQTHQDNLVVVSQDTLIDNSQPPTADASITRMKNQPLVVMTADCGPLVIAGQSIVAVVHASWKTVAAGLIASVVEEMTSSVPNERFAAMLGPCIHPDNYEFEPGLLNDLGSRLGSHVESQTKKGKPAFDLPKAIEHECTTRGIAFESVKIDTYTSSNHYSYRRDGVTGRQGVIAWLK